jgi:hypothetical protein
MNDAASDVRFAYWFFAALLTVLFFYMGLFYEMSLWLQLIPIVWATLGALTVDRSWRGVSIVLSVTLLMYVTFCLRHYGPY